MDGELKSGSFADCAPLVTGSRIDKYFYDLFMAMPGCPAKWCGPGGSREIWSAPF